VAKARWLLVLLVGGTLAVLLTLIPGREAVPVETAQEAEAGDLQLLSFDPWAVTAIVIHHRDGSTLRLRRIAPPSSAGAGPDPQPDAAGDGDGTGAVEWELAEPVTAPADSARVTAAVLALADLRAYRRIDADDEEVDLGAFGLDPPRMRVEVRLEAPAPAPGPVLLVGEPTPIVIGDHPTWYVQVPGRDDVFAAGGPGLALVDATAADLLPQPASLDGDAPAQGDVHD